MPKRGSDSFIISIGSMPLLSSLEVKLKNYHLSMLPSYCIFRTPSTLFRHRKNAFLPNCFSIGPLHHGKENLLASEKIKIKYLNGLLFRVTTSQWSPETMPDQEAKEIMQRKNLTELINAVKLIEETASACYAEHDFSVELGDGFLEVMLLDGCFIIELFRKKADEVTKEPDDPIFSMSCMLQFLSHDLILLENQIPWFSYEIPVKPDLFSGKDIKHILDFLRLSLVLPSQEMKNNPKSGWQPIRSITRLQEAGVKFKKVVEPQSVLDIRYKNGTLEIPSLLIQETTETILRNLIAYEQCLPNCPPIFTCYAKLLDNLIDTPNDLEILCKKDIYDNWLSPEDATQFFNKLYNDTYVKEFYYSKLCDDLDQHCKRCWPRWRAAYVHNYCTKPWAVAAQIYAVIMFVLTLWQTYIKKG